MPVLRDIDGLFHLYSVNAKAVVTCLDIHNPGLPDGKDSALSDDIIDNVTDR